jgi:hypothetical protein
VEIGAEAALFPEKEYISGIFVAVDETPRAPRMQIMTTLRTPKCQVTPSCFLESRKELRNVWLQVENGWWTL